MDAIVYTSELEYAQSDIAPFLRWFAAQHSADLFRAGFYTCTCYRAVDGGLTLVDMYQASTWDVFTGPGYKVRDKDPYARQKLAPRTASVNTVYNYYPMAGANDPLCKIDADWVGLIRFEFDATDAEATLRWLETAEVARMVTLGATSVRLIRRTRDRPGTSSYRPHWAVLTEWPNRPPSLATLTAPLVERLGRPLTEGDAFMGYRLYPWPDDFALLRQT